MYHNSTNASYLRKFPVSKTAAHNAKVIADLRGRLFWAYAWLCTSLALVPLGFCCPCGLAMAVGENSAGVAAVLAIASLLLPFVGLGGLLLMTGDRSKYVRGLELARVAESRKLRYTYQLKKKQYQFINAFSLLADPTDEFAIHFLAGKWRGLPFIALDYSHSYGRGAFALIYKATVFVLQEGFEDLPNFVLYPRGWIDKIGDMIKGSPLKLGSSKKFSKQFAVVTSEPARVASVFSADLIDWCLDEPDLTLEICNGKLLAYRWERTLSADDYEEFLDRLAELVDLLRPDEDEE